MSHSVVVVMAESKSDVDELLAPFDENIQRDPYEVSCYCKETKHRKDLMTNQIEKTGKSLQVVVEELYQKYKDIISAPPEEYNTEREKIYKQYDAIDEEFDKTYIYSFDSDCEECHGTGITTSTYNEDAKWDWYELGGRWSTYKPPLTRAQLSTKRHTPFAILTEDDGWLESATMGWWGFTSEEKDTKEWEEIYFNTISKATQNGLKPFVVDVHI